MNNRSLQNVYIIAAITVVTGLGCQHIGPQSIVADRLAYNKAILTSWEQQTLLNIVRVRYDDPVSFVDVGSVTQQHSLMGSISATLGAALPLSDIASSSLSPSLTGSRSTSDSPSITYTPLTGADFTRNLNAPLKPVDIFNLIESGYKADVFLNLTLYSINGIQSAIPDVNLNRRSSQSAKFVALTRAIEVAYGHGDISFYIQPGADGADAKVFMVIADRDSPEPQYSPVALIRQTLHLNPAETQFEIVAGSRPRNDNEITVRTRSAIAAMRWLSNYVQVPPERLGRTAPAPTAKLLDIGSDPDPPLKVEYMAGKPRGAFAEIRYNGYWFWIRQTDSKSKFALIYLRTLLAYADRGPKQPPPVLTIPVR